jgi:hypothetical protein
MKGSSRLQTNDNFSARENVMKNQKQANNINNLNDQNVAGDNQALVQDLPISREREERVKGGEKIASLKPVEALSYDWPGEYAQRFDGVNKIP